MAVMGNDRGALLLGCGSSPGGGGASGKLLLQKQAHRCWCTLVTERTHALCAVAPRLLDRQHRSSGTALAAQHLLHSPLLPGTTHAVRLHHLEVGAQHSACAIPSSAEACSNESAPRDWQPGYPLSCAALAHSQRCHAACRAARPRLLGHSHTSCLITAALPAALTAGGPPGAGWRRSAARRPARRGRTPGCACAWGRGRAAPSRGWGTCRHKAGGCEQVGAEFIQSWEPDKNRTPSWIRKHAAVARHTLHPAGWVASPVA